MEDVNLEKDQYEFIKVQKSEKQSETGLLFLLRLFVDVFVRSSTDCTFG